MAGRSTVENVDVNLTATDKASKPIGAVADAVDALPDEATIAVDADTHAAVTGLGDVREAADKVDGEKPTLTVDTSGLDGVRADLAKIRDDAHQLAATKTTIDVDADVSRAAAGLEQVDGAAISSVDSLRDVSGAMGDVGGAGLDAAEGVLGLGESLASAGVISERTAGALGKIGFVGAAAALGWQAITAAVAAASGTNDRIERSLDRVITSLAQGGKGAKEFNQIMRDMTRDPTSFSAWSRNISSFFSGRGWADEGVKAMQAFNKVLDEAPGAAAALVAELQQVNAAGVTTAQTMGVSADQLAAMAAKLDAERQSAAAATVAQNAWNDSVTLTTDAMAAGIDTTRRAGESTDDYVARLTKAVRENGELQESYKRVAGSIDAAAGSTDRFRSQLDTLFAKFTEGEAAQINLRKKFEDVTKAITDGDQPLDDLKLSIIDLFNMEAAQGGRTGVEDAFNRLKGLVKPGSDMDVWLDQMQNRFNALFTNYEVNVKVNAVIPPELDRLRRGAGLNFGMAGSPYTTAGPWRVGEAGPEDVWLPRGARIDRAGVTANNDRRRGGGGGDVNYFVTVNVPVGAPTAAVGRYVADALDAHERASGSRRRVA